MVAYPAVMTLILQVHSAKFAKKSTLISLKAELLGQARSSAYSRTEQRPGRMKVNRFLLRLTLFIPFIAVQADVGLAAEAKKEKAPKFVITTFDNKSVSLSNLRGRPILLKFISSW
jgi:hypothetical protein